MKCNNIILITIDCLRKDHLGCYGYSRNTCSFLDNIAEKGTIFENAYANGPFTSASFISLLTSKYPLDYGEMLPLPKKAKILPQYLKEIKTCGITSNPYLSGYYGYNKGWDNYEDFMKYKKNKPRIQKNIVIALKRIIPKTIKNFIKAKVQIKPYEDAKTVTDNGIKWLNKNYNDRFFLWIHYMDLHEPYKIIGSEIPQIYSKNIDFSKQKKVLDFKPDEDIVNDIIDIYDDKLIFIDKNIEKICDFLKEKGIYEETEIIITSDHGQELGEHGGLGHRGKFHKEIINIPLITKSREKGLNRNKNMVEQIDIAPTILESMGIKKPISFRGKNIFNKLKKEYIISEASHDKKGRYMYNSKVHKSEYQTIAIVNKNEKYVQKRKEGKILEELYYNLVYDPLEKDDLIKLRGKNPTFFKKIIEKHINSRMEIKINKQPIFKHLKFDKKI